MRCAASYAHRAPAVPAKRTQSAEPRLSISRARSDRSETGTLVLPCGDLARSEDVPRPRKHEQWIASAIAFCDHSGMRPKLLILAAVAMMLVFLVAAFGSDGPEYGAPDELKGLNVYYVDTGTDVATRNEMAAKLRNET